MAMQAIEIENDMANQANTDFQENMADQANGSNTGDMQRLDCIYDDEPLGFERDPISLNQRMRAQDPLQEIDIGDGTLKRSTYISTNVDQSLRVKMVELLKEFRDCFAWDYDEMPGLSKELVEHRLPLRPDKKPVKQLPR
ncbi:hypothetical protein A2U01_0001984, partial [Trifolium medium]|nr:hypothetical protein [Trifolium medium]